MPAAWSPPQGEGETVTLGELNIAANSLIHVDSSGNAQRIADASSAKILIAQGTTSAPTWNAVSGDVTISSSGAVAIASGVIINADVKSDAAIAYSKLAALTDANILIGDATNVAVVNAITGDITLSNAGVVAIASGVIIDADVKSDAAIAYSKLAALTDANILVGDGSNVATVVAVTGDVTISNSGVTTIGSAKVTDGMLAGSIAPSKITGTAAILGANTFTAAQDLGGNDLDNIQNLIHDISVSGTDIDFSEDELQTISISANTTFTTANRATGKSKTLKILTDGTLRTLTFPAWIFVGDKPADQAASKTGILTLTCFSTTDASIVAAYAVEA